MGNTRRKSARMAHRENEFTLPPNAFIIALIGAGGSGKGTAGRALKACWPEQIEHMVTSKLIEACAGRKFYPDLRTFFSNAEEEKKSGNLCSDNPVTELVYRRALHHAGAKIGSEITMVLDGMPRSDYQAEVLLRSNAPVLYVYFEMKDLSDSLRRIEKRAKDGEPRPDDGAAANRIITFQQKTLPVIELIKRRVKPEMFLELDARAPAEKNIVKIIRTTPWFTREQRNGMIHNLETEYHPAWNVVQETKPAVVAPQDLPWKPRVSVRQAVVHGVHEEDFFLLPPSLAARLQPS